MNETISQAIQQLYNIEQPVVLTRPDPQFGDFATNVALQLAKPLGKKPRDIAEEIAEALRTSDECSEVTVAGPGFINVRLTDQRIHSDARRDITPVHADTHYVIEYSCPNAFKELHTGHLYNTIYGDILARLLERTGAKVSRTSFGGDVGLHVAKAMYGVQQRLGGWDKSALDALDNDPLERARWISGVYVAGSAAYEDDANKSDVVQLNKDIYTIHNTDDTTSDMAQVYWMLRQWSYDYFKAFYHLLQVDTMHYYPESATAKTGMDIVHQQLEKGNLTRSQGAIVFEGDEEKHLHTRVFVTSEGLPTYETKDIGVIWSERDDYQFDHRILLTGNDQKEYMRVVFAAAETFDASLAGTMTHLTSGTVKFADGKKMSSRLGNVARGADVIDVVRENTRDILETDELLEDVTLGAVKYAFAKYRLGSDIAFDMQETVSLSGNSGPYIQYAHARACSILAKAGEYQPHMLPYDENERALMVKLGEYSEVVERAAREYALHHICTYLYELAQQFNRFYEKSYIIGDERQAHRLAIVQRYKDTLADGLALLGIHAPIKM